MTCDVIFEGGESNHEAHSLAKFSTSLDEGHHVWLFNPHELACIPLNIHIDQ